MHPQHRYEHYVQDNETIKIDEIRKLSKNTSSERSRKQTSAVV